MPTVKTKTTSMQFPFPLGKILPGAPFASASVPITQNFTPVLQDGVTPENGFSEIVITADPDNAGPIYICSSASAPDTVNLTNILAKLNGGDSFPREGDWSNSKNINAIFVGAGNATDFAYGYISQF